MKTIYLLDNYDSFTYNLHHYFLMMGLKCQVVKNDEWSVEKWQAECKNALVISPGPKRPEDAGNLMNVINALYKKIPLLGICLGHQALGLHFGATLNLAPKPMHGKTSLIHLSEDPLHKNLGKQMEVMRYHSLLIDVSRHDALVEISRTTAGENMGIKHESLPIYGIQFHPESIGTQLGFQLLENWANINHLLS